MGKEIPRSFEKIRSGEQIQYPTFTNVAAAVAAGVTAAKFPRRIIHLSAGGTGSVVKGMAALTVRASAGSTARSWAASVVKAKPSRTIVGVEVC